MFFWEAFVNKRKEFSSNICGNIFTVGGIKPCYVSGPFSGFVHLVLIALLVKFKFIVVSTFFKASWYGGTASLNISSFEDMFAIRLLIFSGTFLNMDGGWLLSLWT